VSAADYLSLVRIPLGLLFVVVVERVPIALAVLVAAGLSDVLDGWVARRSRPPGDEAHHRGDWLDPLCDKLFVGAVVLGLYLFRQPPVALLLLLITRELLQTVAVTALRLVPALHRASRDYNFKAHPVGKATTVAQFAAGAGLLVGHEAARYAVWLAAGLGVVTVAIYIGRLRSTVRAAQS
jgi:phosphatidylglycerophosphate synthase